MEVGRKIQCTHCRQKLSSPVTKQAKVTCPGCTLESEYPTRYEVREHSSLCPKRLVRKLFGSPEPTTPKTPLTSVPSPLLQRTTSSSRPQKRAVLCGITYNKRKYRLKGTVNDVNRMNTMLLQHFHFPHNGIVVLTEEERPEHIPTRKNIERALKWLVQDCKAGDSLVFYFSGHGLRQPDIEGDETDGFDETICPVDFLTAGMIVDNDINSLIVKPLVPGVTLHAIVDACHSGTILDLNYKYNRSSNRWALNIPQTTPFDKKATGGGLAICISACADDQVASDTTAFTGSMNGAMTYILTELVGKYLELSYGDLIDLIIEKFEEVNKNACLINTQFLKKFSRDSLSQKPQLTSSAEFHVYKKIFKL